MKNLGLGLLFLLMIGCASGKVDGDYNEQTGKAVETHEKAFHACYKKYGAGKDVKTCVKYSLNYAGEIQFVEIDSERSGGSSPAMGDCILNEFKTVKLPETIGHDGVRGTYTFSYTTR